MTLAEELRELERQIASIRQARLEIQEPHCNGVEGFCPNDPIHILRNGEEVENLCEECFKDTLYDLLVSNGRLTVAERQHNDWEIVDGVKH
jgi:hypothetical protein